jgi:hypothetical protein
MTMTPTCWPYVTCITIIDTIIHHIQTNYTIHLYAYTPYKYKWQWHIGILAYWHMTPLMNDIWHMTYDTWHALAFASECITLIGTITLKIYTNDAYKYDTYDMHLPSCQSGPGMTAHIKETGSVQADKRPTWYNRRRMQYEICVVSQYMVYMVYNCVYCCDTCYLRLEGRLVREWRRRRISADCIRHTK